MSMKPVRVLITAGVEAAVATEAEGLAVEVAVEAAAADADSNPAGL